MSEPAHQDPAPVPALDFERAEFSEPAAEQVQCGLCQQPIATEYWHYVGKVLCGGCREAVRRTTQEAQRGVAFGKAFLLGGVVALGCGAGYAIFVGLTNIQFALVTIGIGWAVGRAIQKVTRGFGTRKHQILAVALTYFASSMGYLPALFKAIGDGPQHAETSAAPAGTGASPAPAATVVSAAPPPPAPPPATSEGRPGGVKSLVLAVGIIGYFMLAAPFYDIASGFSGILGLLIIFFGLRTAWRVSKGIDGVATGPHKVGAPRQS